jgi:nucleolar protein 16
MDISMNKAHPLVQKNWDRKLTLLQNYEKLGLIPMLDGNAGGTQKKQELQKQEEEYRQRVIENIEYRRLDEEEAPKPELIEKEVIPDDRVRRLGIQVSLRKVVDPTAKPKTTVVEELEKEAAQYRPVVQHQSEQETLVFEQLVAKYGLDFDAMARDTKLNKYQLSAGQLKRKMKKGLRA